MSSLWGFRAQSEQHVRDYAPRRGVVSTRVSAHFRDLADGSLIFYPQGEFGQRGYIVSSDAQEAVLRKRAWWLHIASLIAQFALVVGLSYAYSADILRPEWGQMAIVVTSLAAIGWAIQRMVFRRWTKNMTPSRVRNLPIAHWRAMGRSTNPFVLFLSTIFLAVITGAGFFFAIQQGSWLLFFCSLAVGSSFVIGGIALQSWWKG